MLKDNKLHRADKVINPHYSISLLFRISYYSEGYGIL